MQRHQSKFVLYSLLGVSVYSTGCQQTRERIASWMPSEQIQNLTRKPGMSPEIQAAISLEREGKLAEAKGLYESELKRHPDEALLLHRLGVVTALLGEKQESREYFAKALKAEPKNVEILTDLGFALNMQGDPAGAEKALQLALREEPDHERAIKNLARVLAFQDRYDESEKEYRKVYNPGETDYRLAMIHVERGQVEQARARLESAKKRSWSRTLKEQIEIQLVKLESMPKKPAVELAKDPETPAVELVKNTEKAEEKSVTTAEQSVPPREPVSPIELARQNQPKAKPFPEVEKAPASNEEPLIAKYSLPKSPKSPAVPAVPSTVEPKGLALSENPFAALEAEKKFEMPSVVQTERPQEEQAFQPPMVRMAEETVVQPVEEPNPFAVMDQEKPSQPKAVASQPKPVQPVSPEQGNLLAELTPEEEFQQPKISENSIPREFQQPITVAEVSPAAVTPIPTTETPVIEEEDHLVAPGFPDEELFSKPQLVATPPQPKIVPPVPVTSLQPPVASQQTEIPLEYQMPITPGQPQQVQPPQSVVQVEKPPASMQQPDPVVVPQPVNQTPIEVAIISGTDPFLEAARQEQSQPRPVIQTVSRQASLTEPAFDPRLPVLLPQPAPADEPKAERFEDIGSLFPIPDYNWKPIEEFQSKVAVAAGWKGYCPVILQQQRQLARVTPQFHSIYQGKQYYFASEEAKAAFDEEPSRFIAVSNGLDVVIKHQQDKQITGSVTRARWYRGHLYFFSSDETMQEFAANPDRYAVSTNQ